jgi:hypothetical protein
MREGLDVGNDSLQVAKARVSSILAPEIRLIEFLNFFLYKKFTLRLAIIMTKGVPLFCTEQVRILPAQPPNTPRQQLS